MKHRIEQDHQCTKIFAEYSMPKTQALVNSILAKKVSKSLLFCYQNCSDQLWEEIVLVFEKNYWNSRLKPENLQNFDITRTIYSNRERSEQFLVRGRSQTTFTKFCPLLPTYLPLFTLVDIWTTTYLPLYLSMLTCDKFCPYKYWYVFMYLVLLQSPSRY